MVAKHGNTNRIESAKQLFYKFLDSLSQNKNYVFALRMYGHTVKYPPGNCKDSKLIVPFSKNNTAQIKANVAAAKPTGITPIEHSLTESANDFPDKNAVNMVILITDGIEECGGDPCAARQKLLEKGIVFKPFIIGIGLSPEQIKTFGCVGNYFDFDEPTTFTTISQIIQQQKLNKTSLQINLLDSKGLPKETDVNLTFTDVKQQKYTANYIHTLNTFGHPDTLFFDDFPTYKVKAHTIPAVESNTFNIAIGKHTTVPLDAPQGFLSINRLAGVYNFNEKVKFIVRRAGDPATINVQTLNQKEKYLTGLYDIEILTLPRIYKYQTKISQSQETVIDIANAGMLQLKALEAGNGCILLETTQKLEWVCNLSPATIQTYYLQPGNYRVAWRSKSLKGSIYTIEKKFRMSSDQQLIVELYN